MPTIELEPPTLSIYIGPNTSPLKGKEGDFTTSRQISDRLNKELETNIALKITPDGLGYKVSGRGELHLSVLIETMRREGYELEAGRPEVVYREIDGKTCEPIEDLTIEVDQEFVGAVSQELGIRKAELISQELTSTGGTRFVYKITTAALIGLRNNLLTATKGTVIMSSIPSGYQPVDSKYKPERNGALIAFESGNSTAYALDAAQARGTLFIPPQVPVYQGMIVGLSNKKEFEQYKNSLKEKVRKEGFIEVQDLRGQGLDSKQLKEILLVDIVETIFVTELILLLFAPNSDIFCANCSPQKNKIS